MRADIGPRSPEQRGIRRAAIAAGLGALALDDLLLDQIGGDLLVELEEEPFASAAAPRRAARRWPAAAAARSARSRASRRDIPTPPRRRRSAARHAPPAPARAPAGLSSRKSGPPLPEPLLDEFRHDLAFRQDEPDEAGLDGERMVEERDHAGAAQCPVATDGFGGAKMVSPARHDSDSAEVARDEPTVHIRCRPSWHSSRASPSSSRSPRPAISCLRPSFSASATTAARPSGTPSTS